MLKRIVGIKSTMCNWKEREKTLKKYSQLTSKSVTVKVREDSNLKFCDKLFEDEGKKKKQRPRRRRRNKSFKQEVVKYE